MLLLASSGAQTEILAEFDAENGTRSARIFEAAQKFNPRLIDTTVSIVGEEDGEAYYPYSLYEGRGVSVVSMPGDLEYYRPYLHGYLATRFDHIKSKLGNPAALSTLAGVFDICISHELGHIDMYEQLFRQGGQQAVAEYDRQYESDLFDLPLATETSTAYHYWVNDTGGYRTYMQKQGHTEESFKAELSRNLAAYAAIPGEARADNFAAVLLGTVYK